MGPGLKILFVLLLPEGDVYQAQTPNVETQEAPEVKEDKHVQVEEPKDQVGSGNRAAVCTTFLILLPRPLPACGPSLPLPPEGPPPLPRAAAHPSGLISGIFQLPLFPQGLLLLGPLTVTVCDPVFSFVII